MIYNFTKCNKCDHVNPPYKNICENCKSYLRDKVVNLDLWRTLLLIIENPVDAFKQIIFSENKNFIIFITILIGLKNLIITRFISVPELGSDLVSTSLFIRSILSISQIVIVLSLFTFLQQFIYKKKNILLRFKDIYSLNAYSFIPLVFGLIFIFPVEIIVLGKDLFSNNPYSFQIKPLITYILIGFEIITIIWSLILIYKSIFIVYSIRFYSILLTFIFLLFWTFTSFISSKIIFTL